MTLSDFDVEVLKELAGLPNTITGWGAGLGMSIECLRGSGYVYRTVNADKNIEYALTDKGRKALDEKIAAE